MEPGQILLLPEMLHVGFAFTVNVAVQGPVDVNPFNVVTNVSVYVPGVLDVTVTFCVFVALNVAPAGAMVHA